MTTRYIEVHKDENLGGPGDGRPTAQQIVEDNDLVGKWNGKVVLVTGTSSGIGVPTCRALKRTGAKVYATARDLEKGRKALADILEPRKLELLELDTGDLASVRACARAFLAKESKLNVLINNAGVMAIPERRTTKDGFEEQMGVNYFGHFLLFQLLKPALLLASNPDFASRVVNVSSSGHRQSSVDLDNLNFEEPGTYTGWVGYGQSKTAVIYMTNEIERRYSSQGLHGMSINPGGIDTGLQVHVQAMIDEAKKNPETRKGMKSLEQGAATTLVAAVDKELEGKGGFYLHDCAVQEKTDSKVRGGPGVASYAMDEEKARQLWDISSKLVGYEE